MVFPWPFPMVILVMPGRQALYLATPDPRMESTRLPGAAMLMGGAEKTRGLRTTRMRMIVKSLMAIHGHYIISINLRYNL